MSMPAAQKRQRPLSYPFYVIFMFQNMIFISIKNAPEGAFNLSIDRWCYSPRSQSTMVSICLRVSFSSLPKDGMRSFFLP